MTEKILVTGAAGFIGGTFTYEALKKGYRVHGIDNFSNSTDKNIRIFNTKFSENFTFSQIDLANDISELREIFEKFKPSIAIHFAGLKAVGESEEKPDLYWRNNVDSTKNILQCLNSKISLIFSSSATVYGDNPQQPLTEKSPISPSSVYGKTKVASEDLITELSLSKDIKSICLRYFNPIGSHKDHKVVEDYTNKPNNLMPRLIQTVKNNTNSINIFGTDYSTKDGTGERDYIHIQDLVDGHIQAMNKIRDLKNNNFYNLGTGNPVSVLELVDTFNSVNDLTVKKNFIERRKGDVEVCFADPAKAYNELDWKAKLTLEEMCRDSWTAVENDY